MSIISPLENTQRVLVPRFIWVFSRSETAHGSAIILCKILQSMAVFLHLNVDLLKPNKSVLFVKRKKSLSVVSDTRYNCNSADGDSVRVWFDSYSEWQDAALTVDLLWPNKSVLFMKDNNVQLG